MGHKEVLKKLFPLVDLEGNWDDHLTLVGDQLDLVQARAADLAAETFPDTTDELLARWEGVYGLIPDSGDTPAQRRKILLAKINERGGLSLPYFANMVAQKDVVVSFLEMRPFRFGINKFGDKFWDADIIFVWQVILSEQHRFPFKFGTNKFGEPFVEYDINNSVEASYERLKPAHIETAFQYFNWGFETGDFATWQSNLDVIDNVTVRTGTYSAKLEATGAAIEGILSSPFVIVPNKKYEIDSWHNITAYTAGAYQFEIAYYSDLAGINLISTDTIFTKSATTSGWEQGTKTFAPASLVPDFVFPATAKSFRIKRNWQSTPTGIAYIDDIGISLT